MTYFSDETKIYFRDFDPNTLTPTLKGNSTKFIDMKDYHRLTVIGVRTVGTGKVLSAALQAATDSAGTGRTTVSSVLSTSAGGLLAGATASMSAGTAGAGIFVLEATSDEIAATVSGGRFVSTYIKLATATDEFGLIFILSEPRYAAAGLTTTGSSPA